MRYRRGRKRYGRRRGFGRGRRRSFSRFRGRRGSVGRLRIGYRF